MFLLSCCCVFLCLPFPHKHHEATLPVYTSAFSFSPQTLEDCTLCFPKPPFSHPPPEAGRCCQRPWHWRIWQTFFFPHFIELVVTLSLLVPASWKLSFLNFHERVTLIFFSFFPLRMCLQLLGLVSLVKCLWSLWICPWFFLILQCWASTPLSVILQAFLVHF